MAVKILAVGGLRCPLMICDVCGKQIMGHEDGSVVVDKADDCRFVHKKCDDGVGCFIGIDTFITQLAHNLSVNTKETKERLVKDSFSEYQTPRGKDV